MSYVKRPPNPRKKRVYGRKSCEKCGIDQLVDHRGVLVLCNGSYGGDCVARQLQKLIKLLPPICALSIKDYLAKRNRKIIN